MLTLEQVFFPCTTPQNVWSGIGVKIKVSFYYAVLLCYVVVYAFISHLKTETFHFIVRVCHFMKVSFYEGLIL